MGTPLPPEAALFTVQIAPHVEIHAVSMGNFSSYIESALSRLWRTPSRILILGLDCAGKTTLLYKLKLGDTITTVPTTGFNVENFVYKNIEFTAWDIGGQSKLRPLWKCYFQGCDAIVYIVDAADHARIDEAAFELRNVLEYEELRDAKVLVFANKQDHPDCMKIEEVRERFNLSAVTKNPWHIEKTIAVTGEGVYEGLEWLSKAIMDK